MLLPRNLAAPTLRALLDSDTHGQLAMESDSRGWQWLAQVRSAVERALTGETSPQSAAEAIDYHMAMMRSELAGNGGLDSVAMATHTASACYLILVNCQ